MFKLVSHVVLVPLLDTLLSGTNYRCEPHEQMSFQPPDGKAFPPCDDHKLDLAWHECLLMTTLPTTAETGGG